MPKIIFRLAFYWLLLFAAFPRQGYAQVNDTYGINHEMADRIKRLKEENGFSSQDFNACQITWTVHKLNPSDHYSALDPHEVTLQYESQKIITLTNREDGSAESIQGLDLNCLEFNDYVYLFFDTLDRPTREKFGLSDLAYVIYSSDKGASWSELISLHTFSTKAKFSLPHNKFPKYVKVFGNKHDHALAIFNQRDETTYLFDPNFIILKTLPVYNRLTNFDDPNDFYYFKNIIYLMRGSCEQVRGKVRCPPRTYLETSRDFGETWVKETLPLITKSYFLTLDNTLYQFYFKPCKDGLINPLPGWNTSLICGHINVRKLSILGEWERPKTLLKTADEFLGLYHDTKPILVWRDFRFHRSRPCGFIPVIGCMDDNPFKGPTVIYAGEVDVSNWHIQESIIQYKK